METRVAVYVDGFNLYHAVKDYSPNKIHLQSLFNDFKKDKEVITQIKYFSAYAYWRPKSVARHKRYVKDLKASGVDVILGQFKEKPKKCLSCGARWNSHEEKETDINIALHLLGDAIDDKYDRAYIVSADSDLVPAVQQVRIRASKDVFIAPPPGCRNNARDLCKSARAFKALSKSIVENHMFPPRS